MIKIKNVKKVNKSRNLEILQNYITLDKYNELSSIKAEQYKQVSEEVQMMLVKYYKHHHFAFPIDYQYNKYGKPYVLNNDIYFNMSHSGTYCIIVISKYEVGIDIEIITDKDYTHLIPKILNQHERSYLNKFPFLVQWTIKESYLKCLGIGLIKNMKDVIIDFDNHQVQYGDYPKLKYKNVTKHKYTYTIINKDKYNE